MDAAEIKAWTGVFALAGSAIAFFITLKKYFDDKHAQSETRRIEATKPFLDRQLKLYTDATQAAAVLATSLNVIDLQAATERFWQLYWGELALVENTGVEAAMVHLGEALEAGLSGKQLHGHSLKLARACRDSLAESWGVREWRNPHNNKIPVEQ